MTSFPYPLSALFSGEASWIWPKFDANV
jgi:hypothetical protein